MNIEMGESLAASWLKHVKKCQIVQTNWKPSCFWSETDFDYVANVLERLDFFLLKADKEFKVFPYKKGMKASDKNRLDIRQIISMTECDVIGISLDEHGGISRYYGVETAFHSDGLHYKSTAVKVAAKIIKTMLSLHLYMGAKEIEVAFMTPVIKKSVFVRIEKVLSQVKQFFANETMFKCEINFYTEGMDEKMSDCVGFKSFYQEVISPIAKIVPFADDGSELFMRSLLMCELGRGQTLPVRSSLRMAFLSRGCTIDQFVSIIQNESTNKFVRNEKSAVNGYKDWLSKCLLLKSRKNDFTDSARRVPSTDEVKKQTMRQKPRKGARNGL